MHTGRASSESEECPLTLNNIPLDLQIRICALLHPADVLTLRETCKTLQLATRQRIVWMAALHRICIDNALFLPSFPILDMSDAELEHAAMAPRRWIDLCASFQKQHAKESSATFHPRTTRIIEGFSTEGSIYPDLFIVPGGRYMVSSSWRRILVWDLGYTSSSECKLIASISPQGRSCPCLVQATPDGMGLVILAFRHYKHSSVYEIYPQSDTPRLTLVARLDFNPTYKQWLLPEKVLWHGFYGNKMIFRVWDYRMNYSTSFSTHPGVDTIQEYNMEAIMTRTAIIVLFEEAILVWAIPPLSPQPPDFFNNDPIHIPPLLRIPFLSRNELVAWKTMYQWYSGSSQPLYFDVRCRDSKLRRFKIIVKPDLLDTTLHFISSELLPHGFYSDSVQFRRDRICEDTLVACWYTFTNPGPPRQEGIYTSLISSCPTTIISPPTRMLVPDIGEYSLCPASGRSVHVDRGTSRIVVSDFL